MEAEARVLWYWETLTLLAFSFNLAIQLNLFHEMDWLYEICIYSIYSLRRI